MKNRLLPLKTENPLYRYEKKCRIPYCFLCSVVHVDVDCKGLVQIFVCLLGEFDLDFRMMEYYEKFYLGRGCVEDLGHI